MQLHFCFLLLPSCYCYIIIILLCRFSLHFEVIFFSHNFFVISTGSLISRISIQRVLEVKPEWTPDTYDSSAGNTSISFEYRVTCDSNYYGAGCTTLCRVRDDSFGHYSCDSNGKRVCQTGWAGEYCEKRKSKKVSL